MAGRAIRVSFNSQQLELLRRPVTDGLAADIAGVIRLALRGQAVPKQAPAPAPAAEPKPAPADRVLQFEHVMEPGTGKAMELRAGQILRIEQTRGRRNASTSTASTCTTTARSCMSAACGRCTASAPAGAISSGRRRRASGR